jgi:phosphoglycerate dehydrogenase-like enzyme
VPRPLVIQTEHLHAEAAAWLAERCELVVCPSEDEPRFGELLARAEALVIRTYTRVDGAMLARAPRLRVVGRAGVGLDNVDVPACEARGVTVLNTPDANTRAVVEYVAALLLDALRPRVFLERALDTKAWKGVRSDLIADRQLCEMTLGIWGLGKIGRQVARMARSLDMRVVYYDLLDIPEAHRHGATPVSRDDMLRQADALTIHVDGRAENHGILDAYALAQCKPDAVILNTSRGFVVHTDALAAFLRQNPGAKALLDVHEPEPFDATYELLGVENAWLSPHIASATSLAHRNMSWVVKDVWEALQRHA